MNDTPKRTHSRQEKPAENTAHPRKRSKKNGKALYYLVLALLLGVLVFSCVKIVTYLKEQKDSEDTQNNINNEFTTPVTPEDNDNQDTEDKDKEETPAVEPEPESISVDFASLQAKYPDVVGYIYGANTGLSYPIVQTAEEGGQYYLYRDIDGNDNKNGTIFLDWRCSSDFTTSNNNLIYGHNMKSGRMFAPLMNYKSQSYYDAHPYLYLYTPSQTYKVNLFAGFVTPHNSDVYAYSLSSSYLQECINSSTFNAGMGVPTGNILTMSTCDYDYDNARYVVLGELVPVE